MRVLIGDPPFNAIATWVIRYSVRSILIAAKQLELAKTRLATVLPPGERIALAEACGIIGV